MPTLTVAFRQRAQTAAARSQKGTVAFLIRDAAADEKPLTYTLSSTVQIPAVLGRSNQNAIRRVFKGGVNPPKKVLVYVMGAEAVIDAASGCLEWLATQKFDYLAGPADLSAEEAQAISKWVIQRREDDHAVYKAVLPNLPANHEAIVNFTAAGIRTGDGTFSAAAYCGRIAGLIAGTPMKQSVTYAALPEVEAVTRLTPTELDAAVGRGELVLYHDGEKVKLGRGVNSLTTITGRSDIWKKIKLVECLDMIQSDIRLTVQDNYIGKYANTYDNKCLLITAITDYLRSLARDGLIDSGFTVGIDVEEQTAWLESNGTPTVDMSEQEIKQANTGSWVFLTIYVRPVDAMEDVQILIYL